MKTALKIFGVLVFLALLALARSEWLDWRLRVSVAEVRNEARQQSFRTELADFDFALPPEIQARAGLILSASQAVRTARAVNELKIRESVGTNAAIAISLVSVIETERATNLWPVLREQLAAQDGLLEPISLALLAGPVKFQPSTNGDIRLPYVADYKTLGRTLAVRAVLAMRERQSNAMFTNLFALSRMVTAWTPEPTDICHLVRFSILDLAEQALWESMQTDLWSEPRLAALQKEWASVTLLDSLPATAELNCANMVRMCQRARAERFSERIGGWGPMLRAAFSAPRTGFPNLWLTLKEYPPHAAYRDRGSYEDERALLLHSRERQREMKRAVAAPTWSEMRLLPGVTNVVPSRGAQKSRITSIMNLKQLSLNFQGSGRTLLSRAAETESKRRIIITALALERFAIQHRKYPSTLQELVPNFLPAVPLDFMDGQALRYRRDDDDRFILYSIGLDGEDNGGRMRTPRSFSNRSLPRDELLPVRFTTDIVWPRRATQADVDLSEAQQKQMETEVSE